MTTTPMAERSLLDAREVNKRYGAVQALRDAWLSVRPGEVHGLLGANGAGKSTLVKILTGAVAPDSGSVHVEGVPLVVHSPAQARAAGLVSVYQEPSLIPDLDVLSNLRLTLTPVGPFLARVSELGILDLDPYAYARELPLPTLRILDLARALALEPKVLLLDEMTAALPSDLTERVLDVVGRYRETGRSVIFISHRLLEVAALCDRATVLRDGETVGVVDMSEGAADRIVSLMLGPASEPGATAAQPSRARARSVARDQQAPRLAVRGLGLAPKLQDVSFEVHAGEVLGIVALEGQGQDELFEVLAGARRPDRGELVVDGKVRRFGHPADAIGAGLVYVPADRAEALLPQRSVHENVALPLSARMRSWGLLPVREERRKVGEAVERLQVDTRAGSEARRLSGGNQQKVTIARWIAGGVRTLLCFDPTRGIDIRTKREIYRLLRDLADGGAAILLYTSELDEIQAACDRAIVVFGGRVVDELPAEVADEPTLLRSSHGLAGEDALAGEATRTSPGGRA
jgi:ribose transport system ATP-binding protein